MLSPYLGVIAIFCFAQWGYTSPLEPFFRDDYKYESRQEAFYKVCGTPQRWSEAYSRCAAEGAQLAYPRSDSEAALFVQLMSNYLPKSANSMWVGAHDLYAEGVYVTLDGEDICTLFDNWQDGQPNDDNFDEDCIAISRDTTIDDNVCNLRLPAICKKSLLTLTANAPCETADLAYVPNVEGTRCYKIHSQPKNWSEAFFTCHAEQSYLAEINSKSEADFLVKLLEKYPEEKLSGNFNKENIAVGFTDLFVEGEYKTTHGKTLQESGYVEWISPNQPDDYEGMEDCGSIYRDGKLNDISCSTRMMFICERDLGDPNAVDLFSRFSDFRATS